MKRSPQLLATVSDIKKHGGVMLDPTQQAIVSMWPSADRVGTFGAPPLMSPDCPLLGPDTRLRLQCLKQFIPEHLFHPQRVDLDSEDCGAARTGELDGGVGDASSGICAGWLDLGASNDSLALRALPHNHDGPQSTVEGSKRTARGDSQQ